MAMARCTGDSCWCEDSCASSAAVDRYDSTFCVNLAFAMMPLLQMLTAVLGVLLLLVGNSVCRAAGAVNA